MNSSSRPAATRPPGDPVTDRSPAAAPVKINPALLGATLVGALGGLLFGFDTAVISGCQTDLVKLFTLTSGQQGFMTASAMLGATIGSLAAAKPGDRFGRRDCLKIVAAFYFLCAIGCAFSSSLAMIVRCSGRCTWRKSHPPPGAAGSLRVSKSISCSGC